VNVVEYNVLRSEVIINCNGVIFLRVDEGCLTGGGESEVADCNALDRRELLLEIASALTN